MYVENLESTNFFFFTWVVTEISGALSWVTNSQKKIENVRAKNLFCLRLDQNEFQEILKKKRLKYLWQYLVNLKISTLKISIFFILRRLEE